MKSLSHYTREPFELDRSRTYSQVKEPAGARMNTYDKPRGLWVSADGPEDWAWWCTDNEVRWFPQDNYRSIVTLRPDALVIVLNTLEEFDAFESEYGVSVEWGGYDTDLKPEFVDFAIDWRRVASDFQGILIPNYLWQRRMDSLGARRVGSISSWYYTWDCASGCIWNLEAIDTVISAADNRTEEFRRSRAGSDEEVSIDG